MRETFAVFACNPFSHKARNEDATREHMVVSLHAAFELTWAMAAFNAPRSSACNLQQLLN